jgi:hypothetical protein
MKLYAATPARRTRQILSDAFMLLWVGVWVWLGRVVHDAVIPLRAPADSLTEAGVEVEDALNGAGQQASRLPVVGDQLRDWLGRAAHSGTSMQDAGTSMADTVENVALILGLVTAIVPIAIVGAVWLWLRLRFVTRATTAQRFVNANEDLDLFALRAMANQPLTALARISPDPAGAWRRQDPDVVRALARLELRSEGLRPPVERGPSRA